MSDTTRCVAWCDFCIAIQRTGNIGHTPEYLRHFPESPDATPSRVLSDSSNFAVLPTIGQIVEGYLLLITKTHYASMSHIPIESIGELTSIYIKVRDILEATYGPAVAFEHGPMPVNSENGANAVAEGGGSCVDHAHIHFLPVNPSSDFIEKLKQRYPWREITEFEQLQRQSQENIPYFFVELPTRERYVFDAPQAPSQFLRRLLAAEAGVPEKWNWRIYPEFERMQSTLAKLQHHFDREDA